MQEMYEKEFSSHKKSENTIKIYESQVKKFEIERLQQESGRSQLKELQEKCKNQVSAVKQAEMYESIAKNLELKLKQNQTEIKDLQEKYNKECFTHQENLSLRNMFESRVKDLEFEKEQNFSKFTFLKSQVTEMQEKYKNECAAHQLDEKLKEMYKSQIKILQKGKENTQRF
jgi:hypothetical protein